MKVYDIIFETATSEVGERVLKSILGHTTWSAAQKIAFKDSVELCTDAIEQMLLKGQDIATPAGTKAAWFAIQPRLQGTPWATRDFVQEVFNVSKAEAEDRVAKKAGAFKPKEEPKLDTGTTNVPTNNTPTNPTSAVTKSTQSKIWDWTVRALIGWGLFNNVKYVLTDPRSGYFPVMQSLAEKLESKAITPAEFEQLHTKQLRLATGRLVWEAAPFAAGTLIKLTAWLPVKGLNLLSKRLSAWTGDKVDKVASVASLGVGPKSYAVYINFLNSDYAKELITTIVLARTIVDNSGSSGFITGAANLALLANNAIINGATMVANTAEKTLELALDGIEQTTGSTIPDALKSAGLSKTPPTKSNTPAKTTPQANTTAPATPVSTGEFNPADWKQLKSGMYQNSKTGEILHPSEFSDKSQ